jgi:hypothetical protein
VDRKEDGGETMTKTLTPLVILLTATILLLGGCRGHEEMDPHEMQIRTYQVPEGIDARQFRGYLADSLRTGEQNLGTVKNYPDGSLVVTAPVSVHDSIEDLLADMARRGPREPEPAPSSVTLSYWFLLGRPVQGSLRPTLASPGLRQSDGIQSVLDEIVKAQGGMEFRLLEKLRLKSLDSGDRAEIRGRRIAIAQKVFSHDSEERLADIKVTIFGSRGVQHSLESRIKLEPGRFVVLGQTAYNGAGHDIEGLDTESEDLMLYYVISSEID